MLTAEAIIDALEGDPRTGMCCCPAHEDRSPSLHVGEGRDGRLLLYCFGGCTYEQIVQALARKGIEVPRVRGRTVLDRSKPERDAESSSAQDQYHRFKRAFEILRELDRCNGQLSVVR